MPTQSEVPTDTWAAHPNAARRSVFSNFKQEPPAVGSDAAGVRPSSGAASQVSQKALTDAKAVRFARVAAPEHGRAPIAANIAAQTLQSAIDTAISRSLVYQFLARAYDDPSVETWRWLRADETRSALAAAQRCAAPAVQPDVTAALAENFRSESLESFQAAYVAAFGHAARGDCPLNEIEYGDLKADPLFQPHRLADLAAFYRAFGMEVADTAGERPDHIGMELEFMAILTAKEAYALEHQLDEGQRQLCRQAQKKFLREHLGRWSPAFARRLERAATSPALAALARFTTEFIVGECRSFGVNAGSQDLWLRPVDEAAESLCSSCGLKNLPGSAAEELK
jgi:DMSO reductase family type II enzyme chaperone